MHLDFRGETYGRYICTYIQAVFDNSNISIQILRGIVYVPNQAATYFF